ncbi:cyclic AMP-responsive element-binding protein 3-like protein 1 [Lethenteron reissneri]|uniref:cyclic AMP-responsive element-binding protein 3-like protein 1 n=1 Tax=Lethenteron reissneri TaxID=7753 RepID=UPI002AB6A6A9|nr:cyclic AMP-responsive element-binding protein 3-like protein 1 [Lethenteron reissneri]
MELMDVGGTDRMLWEPSIADFGDDADFMGSVHLSENLEEFSQDLFNTLFEDPLLVDKSILMEVDLTPAQPHIQAEHSYSTPQSPLAPLKLDDFDQDLEDGVWALGAEHARAAIFKPEPLLPSDSIEFDAPTATATTAAALPDFTATSASTQMLATPALLPQAGPFNQSCKNVVGGGNNNNNNGGTMAAQHTSGGAVPGTSAGCGAGHSNGGIGNNGNRIGSPIPTNVTQIKPCPPKVLPKIKIEPNDVEQFLSASAAALDRVHLPPTPPSSHGSDSEGSLSPRSLPPSSPVRGGQPGLKVPARGPSSALSNTTLLTAPHKLQGAAGPLMLTEEEKRTLITEGYPVPTKLPLTKAEEKALKKIRRKIKNKISAQESRRKKKEYVECLEKKVENCASENSELRKKVETLETANRSLLQQLQRLQTLVASKVPRPGKVATTQTSTCLMVVALCFALVLGGLTPSLSPLTPSSLAPSSLAPSSGHSEEVALTGKDAYTTTRMRSRSLLFYEDGPSLEDASVVWPHEREERLYDDGAAAAGMPAAPPVPRPWRHGAGERHPEPGSDAVRDGDGNGTYNKITVPHREALRPGSSVTAELARDPTVNATA